MNSIRTNPDGEENTRLTEDNARSVFAAKMAKQPVCVCVGVVNALVTREGVRMVWECCALDADGNELWSLRGFTKENTIWLACLWARENNVTGVHLTHNGQSSERIDAAHWLKSFEPKAGHDFQI